MSGDETELCVHGVTMDTRCWSCYMSLWCWTIAITAIVVAALVAYIKDGGVM